MDSEKSITSFKIKNDKLPHYLLYNNFFNQFFNNFLALLLCKIKVLIIFDMGDFFHVFVISRTTEILIESKLWFGMYVPYIFN